MGEGSRKGLEREEEMLENKIVLFLTKFFSPMETRPDGSEHFFPSFPPLLVAGKESQDIPPGLRLGFSLYCDTLVHLFPTSQRRTDIILVFPVARLDVLYDMIVSSPSIVLMPLRPQTWLKALLPGPNSGSRALS